MSSQSNKSSSWFARLRSALGRKRRSAAPDRKRRGLRFESLESRSLLSATVLPTISGVVYQDLGSGALAAADPRVANVTVNLFRDGGAGVFEGINPGSDDSLIATTTTSTNGTYSFTGITAGTYFVQEVGVPGLVVPTGTGVQEVVVTSADLQGATGTMIDSFASTPQYASGSLHGGTTGMSSASATGVIGGHRNLYVQLTTAGGAVDLGADYNWPGLLDFGADSGSNGTFNVNWDGNNSNAAQLNPTGLGQVDLTAQGAATGIELNAAADHDNCFIMLKVFSNASNWSWATAQITDTGDGSLNSSDSQFVSFSSFTVGGGTGANFSQVGAFQLSIDGVGVNALDGQVGPIQTVGPMVLTENLANTPQADLSVVKSATPNPVTAGSQLTYTFTTTNIGPGNDTGVTLSDTLPAGETYVSSSGQGAVTNNSGTLSVQLGSMALGAVATTNIVVAVSPTASGSLTNTVSVTGNDPDPNSSNNTSTVTTQINQSADLSLTKTVSEADGKPGDQLTYTLTATNNGPSNATGVSIVDTLPNGFEYMTAHGQTSATIVNNTLTLNVGNLAVGASDTITVGGQIESFATGTLTNSAMVGGNQPDPNPANNTATASTVVSAQIIQSTTNLTIVKAATPTPSVLAGGNLTYSMTVTNSSLNGVTGVTVSDTMPAGFRYFSEISQYPVTVSGNTFSFALGAMPASGVDIITFEGVVTAAAGSTITNWATVSDYQGDTAKSNTVVTTVFSNQGSKFYLLGR